jgi:hypothetical protein
MGTKVRECIFVLESVGIGWDGMEWKLNDTSGQTTCWSSVQFYYFDEDVAMDLCHMKTFTLNTPAQRMSI